MANDNRGRLTVNPAGNWRLYSNTLPAGSVASGTVTRDDTDSGALAMTGVGVYVQVNAGEVRTLDQRKIKAALGIGNGAGRPVALDAGRRVSVFLDAGSLERAAALGGGNVSEGIRLALSR